MAKLVPLNPKANELLGDGRSQVGGILNRINSLPSGSGQQAQALVQADPNITAGLASAAALIPGLNPTNTAFTELSLRDRMIAQAQASQAATQNTINADKSRGIFATVVSKLFNNPVAKAAGYVGKGAEAVGTAPFRLTGTYDDFKGAVRTGIAAATSLYQGGVQGNIRYLADKVDKGQYGTALASLLPGTPQSIDRTKSAFDQTDFGQLVKAIVANPSNVDTGSGYLMSGTVVEKQRQASIEAYKLNGAGLTLGRGLMSTFGADPNGTAYRVGSGIIDAVASILLDPTIFIGKTKAAVSLVKEAEKLTEGVSAAAKVTKDAELSDTLKEIAALKDELLTVGDTVRAAKIADAEARAAVAREVLTSRQDRLAQVDPDIQEGLTRIAEFESQKTSLAERLKEAEDLTAESRRSFAEQTAAAAARTEREASNAAVVIDRFNTTVGTDTVKAQLRDLNTVTIKGGYVADTALDAVKRGSDPVGTAIFAKSADAPGYITWKTPKNPIVVDASTPIADDATKKILQFTTGKNDITKVDPKTQAFPLWQAVEAGTATLDDIVRYAVALGRENDLVRGLDAVGVDAIANTMAFGDKARFFYSTTNTEFAPIRIHARTGQPLTIRATADQRRPKVLPDYVKRNEDTVKQIKGEISRLERNIKEQRRALKPYEQTQRQYQALVDRAMSDYANSMKAIDEAGIMSLKGSEELVAKKLADALEHLSGLSRDPQGVDVAYSRLADFIAGKYAEPLINYLVKKDDVLDVWDSVGRSIPIDIASKIAKATNREEVLQALAPTVGTKLDGALDIPSATRLAADAGPAATRMMPRWVKDTYIKGHKKLHVLTGEIPNGKVYHIDDMDGLARAINDYGVYLKLPQQKIDDLLRKFVNAPDDTTRAKIASIDLFNTIFENASQGLKPFQKEALYEATRIFDGGKTGLSKFWAMGHATGSFVEYAFGPSNTKIRLNGPHLESELLNSSVYLPNPDEMRKAMDVFSKVRGFNEARIVINGTLDFWRTSKLLRPAYTVRNLAEMQFRMFLTGHASFLNNPVALAAMVMGKTDGPAWRKLMSRIEQYDKDALGRDFKYIPDSDDEKAAQEVIEEFLEFKGSQAGSFDQRASRAVALQGVTTVGYNDKQFAVGLATELRKLGTDRAARILAGKTPPEIKQAMAKGATWEDAVVDYFHTGKGADYMSYRATNQPDAAPLFTTKEGIAAYLFDETNGLMVRVNEATGRIPALKLLVAQGSVKVDGKVISIGKNLEGFEDLARSLKPFKGNEAFKGVTVTVRLRDAAMSDVAGKPGEIARNLIDSWFRWNNKIEKNTAMAPEWRQSYWEEIAKIAGSLDSEAVAKLQANARESLLGLRIAGKTIGERSPLMKIINSAKGDGPLTLDMAHAFAAEKATKHVKGLFYNAYQRKSFFHALRHMIPFGQAYWDTLYRWGQLAKDNPVQVYKAAKFLDAVQEPGSNVVYDITLPVAGESAVTDDPNQGFIFTDPQTGKRRMFIPFMGSILGKLAEKTSGVQVDGSPFEMMADPMSLNFAFGSGSVAPPVGPGITLPVQAFGDNFINWLPMPMRTWLFPFKTPGAEEGIIESQFLPAYARRMLAFFSKGGVAESTFASTVRPVADYLAAGGGYDLYDAEDQKRLFTDAYNFARFFGAWRGVAQGFSPSTPLAKSLAKFEDANNQVAVVAQAGIYSAFEARRKETGDYYQAVWDTLDTFGAANVYALIGATKGGVPPTTEAFDFLRTNSKLASKYDDVFAYFFPNGEFSQEFWRWQTRTGTAETLNFSQVQQQGTYILYMAAKSQLDLKEAAGTITKEEKSYYVDKLEDTFGGRPQRVKVGTSAKWGDETKYLIGQVEKALKEPAFAQTKAGQAAQIYLALRNEALKDSQLLNYKSLGNKASAENRAWLRDAADAIDQYYGGEFKLLYENVFENEVRD